MALYLEDGDQTLTNGDPNSSHNVQYIDMRINNAKLWKTPVRFAYVCFVRFVKVSIFIFILSKLNFTDTGGPKQANTNYILVTNFVSHFLPRATFHL